MDTMTNLRTIVDRALARWRKGKIICPVVHARTGEPYPVTYAYGIKSTAYAAGHHTGEDHACPTGSPVRATSYGTVIFAGAGSDRWGPAYGNQVIIRTADGRYDYGLCHLSKVTAKAGDRVVPGLVVGLSGATGNVTGPHLHFEARTAGGSYGTDVHPIRVKRGKGVNK